MNPKLRNFVCCFWIAVLLMPCLVYGSSWDTWSSSFSYTTGDSVTYKGNAYKATSNSTGASPDAANTTYWKLLQVSGGGGQEPSPLNGVQLVSISVGSGTGPWFFTSLQSAWNYVRDATIPSNCLVVIYVYTNQTFTAPLDLSSKAGERILIAGQPTSSVYPKLDFSGSTGGIQIQNATLGTPNVYYDSSLSYGSWAETGLTGFDIVGPTSPNYSGVYLFTAGINLYGHVVISNFNVGVDASNGSHVSGEINSLGASSGVNEQDTSSTTVAAYNCNIGFRTSETSTMNLLGTRAESCGTGYFSVDTSSIATYGSVAKNCALGMRAHASGSIKVMQLNLGGSNIKTGGVTNDGGAGHPSYLQSYVASYGGRIICGYNWRQSTTTPFEVPDTSKRFNLDGFYAKSGAWQSGSASYQNYSAFPDILNGNDVLVDANTSNPALGSMIIPDFVNP